MAIFYHGKRHKVKYKFIAHNTHMRARKGFYPSAP